MTRKPLIKPMKSERTSYGKHGARAFANAPVSVIRGLPTALAACSGRAQHPSSKVKGGMRKRKGKVEGKSEMQNELQRNDSS